MDRYKSLLLKQRDIMIALTARLNERDETIINLQSECDALERITIEVDYSIKKKNRAEIEENSEDGARSVWLISARWLEKSSFKFSEDSFF